MEVHGATWVVGEWPFLEGAGSLRSIQQPNRVYRTITDVGHIALPGGWLRYLRLRAFEKQNFLQAFSSSLIIKGGSGW